MAALNITETVERFSTLYQLNKAPGDTKLSFRCGRTDNLEQCKVDHKILTYLATTECDNNEIALKLLSKLQEFGFAIDTPDSQEAVFVYLYKAQNDKE